MAEEQYIPQPFPGSYANPSDPQDASASSGVSKSQAPSSGRNIIWKAAFIIALCGVLFSGCRSRQAPVEPTVEFTRIPRAEDGGTRKLDAVEGRVTGAQPGQQIVLFARSGDWYIQPYVDQPFTEIQADSTWKNLTHLGTEYAALLVDPDYRPPVETAVLPGKGGGVVAVAVQTGEALMLVPLFWQTWWFWLASGLALGFGLLAFYRFRMRQLTKQLNVRFEERLAERMRIAHELHDTLLQGILSASMQLHVATERLPTDSPIKPAFSRVLELMGQVIDEGRNAVQGLRSSDTSGVLELEQAFSRIQQELIIQEPIGFRVIIEGRTRPLHPIIRDEVYRIGREALVNAFHHAQAKNIEVAVEYLSNQLRILVRDDGCGIDPQVLRAGREGHWGLSGMRERAEAIGARFKVRSRLTDGTEVELSVPGHVAYPERSSSPLRKWFSFNSRKAVTESLEIGKREPHE